MFRLQLGLVERTKEVFWFDVVGYTPNTSHGYADVAGSRVRSLPRLTLDGNLGCAIHGTM